MLCSANWESNGEFGNLKHTASPSKQLSRNSLISHSFFHMIENMIFVKLIFLSLELSKVSLMEYQSLLLQNL